MEIDKTNKNFLRFQELINNDNNTATPLSKITVSDSVNIPPSVLDPLPVALEPPVALIVQQPKKKQQKKQKKSSLLPPPPTAATAKWWLCRWSLSLIPVVRVSHPDLEKQPGHSAIDIFDNDIDWSEEITYRYQTREVVVRSEDLYTNKDAANLVVGAMLEESLRRLKEIEEEKEARKNE